jgi:hypothetical protein
VRYNIAWTRFAAAIAALAALATSPALATAQTAPSTPANQGGPMTVEAIDQHFAIAPEYKVSKLGSSTAQLVGAHGGVYVTKSFLVGGGIYTMTNGDEGRRGLTYGGAVVGWQPWSTGTFGVNFRGLVGMGRGTTSETVTLMTRDRRGVMLATREGMRWFTTDLLVAEPQIDLSVGLTKHLHLEIGGGYRFATADGIDKDRFSGASGSVALRIGSAE